MILATLVKENTLVQAIALVKEKDVLKPVNLKMAPTEKYGYRPLVYN